MIAVLTETQRKAVAEEEFRFGLMLEVYKKYKESGLKLVNACGPTRSTDLTHSVADRVWVSKTNQVNDANRNYSALLKYDNGTKEPNVPSVGEIPFAPLAELILASDGSRRNKIDNIL